MGKYGWSKEEQDKILEEKKKRNLVKNQKYCIDLNQRRKKVLENKARRILNQANVSLVEGGKGYLTFEVKSIHSKERYIIHRDRLGNWSGLYTFRDKDNKKLDVMQLVNNPDKSAYIKACEMWLKEYKEG